MRDSIHVVGRLSSKERKVVVQNGLWVGEGSVKWVAQVLVKQKVPRLACRSLVGSDEVEA